MKKAFYALAAVLLLAMGATTWLTWQAWDYLHTAPETPGRAVVLAIEPGSTFDSVARDLESLGVIDDVDRFRLLGKWKKQLGAVKAGEFELTTGMTPPQVLSAITSGKVILHRLQVVEGLTWWQVGRVVEQSGLAGYESFEAAVHDKELLAAHHIPADTAEGFLYPDTYSLPRPRGGDARPIVAAMLDTFWRHAAPAIWPSGRPEPKELMRIVTLASMVEKETGAAEERGAIAGVFANRLKRRMRLQCDPTTIYGLGLAFDGNLKKTHLTDRSNPYNTYTHGGLPPGPICSPGLDALKAAADPEGHNYLYFVATGDGRHHFSATLTEHNKAVRKYQLRRR